MDTILFEKYGSGDTSLIFIHAFPLDGRMWMQQVLHFKDRYTVIIPDLRGFGKNNGNEEFIPSMETYSNDILQLMDQLNIEKAVLCGLSLGGYIALRCIQKFPQRISRLILADTKAENDNNAGLLSRMNTLDLLQQEGKKEEVLNALLPKLISKDALTDSPSLVQDVRSMMDGQQPLAMAHATAAMAMRLNSIEVLNTIDIPVLLITGSNDQITPPECAYRMQQQINNSTVVIIEDAGHLSNLEDPVKFNAALDDFLGS